MSKKSLVNIRVIVVDDSDMMHRNIDLYFSTYTKEFLTNKGEKVENNLYIPSLSFDIDHFKTVEDFIKGRKGKYDFGIIDWNLGSKDTVSIMERGDTVIKKLGDSCKLKMVLTGMTHDVLNKNSDLNNLAREYPDLVVKTKTSQTMLDIFDILNLYFTGT